MPRSTLDFNETASTDSLPDKKSKSKKSISRASSSKKTSVSPQLSHRSNENIVFSLLSPREKPDHEPTNLPPLSPTEEKMLETLSSFALWGNLKKLNEELENPEIRALINRLNAKGQNALHCACTSGHTEVVLRLLNCDNIDVNLRDAEQGMGVLTSLFLFFFFNSI